ncbi:MAG: ABC transporter ATP-binding protein [Elusimicrobiaceae bacterium]|nr:ABC transporter ATP-binding protein [Elusimicrobiaceae bacterium]
MALLEITGLTVDFSTELGAHRALEGFSLALEPGETMAVVGESGSGKTVQALAVMGLLQSPPAKIVAGTVKYNGTNLLALEPEKLRRLRGDRIAMIFQDPMTSLNPVFTVGAQIEETLLVHNRARNREEARRRTIELLADAGIDSPADRAGQYPHQFSGGMRQRAMIACALACNPDLLIADEPTTALDVTIQAQILKLLAGLRLKYKAAVLLITHNLGIVAENADRVTVLYGGRVMERAKTAELLAAPRHPYTRGLLRSLPSLKGNPDRLSAIAGAPPAPYEKISGCVFSPRCPRAFWPCKTVQPAETVFEDGSACACHLYSGGKAAP